MTSQKKWPLVITLLLILSLFLVACERPLPDDGNASAPQEAPVPGTYPGPAEGDPGQQVPQSEDGGSGYPAPDAGPAQPAEEAPPAEAYPPLEGEETSEDPVEGEAAESAEGETTDESADPSPDGEAAEGQATEETVIEGESGQDPAAEEDQTADEGENAQSGGERTHVVAAGENMYQIGLQYGISWVAIAQANGIVNPDSITVGQELIIPDVSESDTEEPADETIEETPESSDAAETPEQQAVQPTDEEETEEDSAQTTYIVQSGDNLYRISLMFGVNMMDVARANDLANFDDLSVGQELIIPGVEEEAGEADTADETETDTDAGSESEAVEESEPEPPSAEEVSHQVVEGETIFGIAFQYGIAWTKLVERNDLTSPYTLEPGQVLVIPPEE